MYVNLLPVLWKLFLMDGRSGEVQAHSVIVFESAYGKGQTRDNLFMLKTCVCVWGRGGGVLTNFLIYNIILSSPQSTGQLLQNSFFMCKFNCDICQLWEKGGSRFWNAYINVINKTWNNVFVRKMFILLYLSFMPNNLEL